MKYTVLIRQPVPEEIRPQLEEQLVSRFGLSAEQAQRLAARRSGRLMKPTSQARAELLVQVFESVGAQVSLEEVRADGPGAAAPVPVPAVPADPVSAGQSSAGAPDPFASAGASDPFTPSSDLFADLFSAPASSSTVVGAVPGGLTPTGSTAGGLTGVAGAGTGAAPQVPPLDVNDADPDVLPDWARSPAPARGRPDREAPAAGGDGAGNQTGNDDWADFTGSLSMPESDTLQVSRPAGAAPRQSTEFLTEVGDEAVVNAQPRHSLTQQIRLGTLAPLVLSGLLTLGLLLLTLPRLEQRLMQSSAQTLASVIGTTLPGGAAAQAAQLGAAVRDPNVGFVRLEVPGGNATLRSSATSDLPALNTRLAAWSGSARPAGRLRVGNQDYAVSRVSIVRGSGGVLRAVPAGQENSAPVVRRVTVGVASAQAAASLRSTLGLVVLTTLLGLLLALAFAARAARQIVGPLERLVEVADAISLGDLTRPVRMERNDEIGDLAQALERMRLSLEAAMDRLRRRKRT
ncbi:HAMP domain-containing protein [Deinococcus wulumuqiensis]|uniref:histidine kinase n=1 Tax=Deinococcus wulumuqiensis TaxID=980427 RepID=A0A345IEP6_9DEIO|nr:HAMP domain-containing protein [Deinococcus wulumuqiensis]AXG98168.1 HAMP domain-containing protein [Deinococcus wulumuqiensis]